MVQRWQFQDYFVSADIWTMPINPYEMSSPLLDKNITARHTTATTGKSLLFEGSPSPKEWTFSGVILGYEHYRQLQRWKEKRNRIFVTDHFGRWFVVYLTKYEPIPKRRRNRYWSHDYTMTALVLEQMDNLELAQWKRDGNLVGTDQ